MMADTSTTSDALRPPSSWVPDVVAALLLVAFLVFVMQQIPATRGDRRLDALGYALLVIAGGAVAFARRRPVTVAAVTTAVLLVYSLRAYTGGPIYATGWIALAAVSWRTDRRTALLAAAGMSVALGIAHVLVSGTDLVVLLVFLGWSAAAVFLGDAARSRSSYLAELAERAHHLERTREEGARRRVAEDRLRIARDLHDSVAHAMATINVQAGSAAHVADRNPDAAVAALATIQRASGEVLDELAAMLRLLRQDAGPADRTPTPDLTQLDDLLATTRSASLSVGSSVDGAVEHVPPAVSVAAYRIVQESLTNVIRHAGPGAVATMAVQVGPDGACEVLVRDDGAGAGPSADRAGVGPDVGAGVGIQGMRERAAATGGVLEAGPRPDGGFVVRATWPASSPAADATTGGAT